ncbi:HET-domain-containing protein [Daldinia bambusicola]|nr:HET-domain-containing protein [Daldinia bambusicola]
MFMPSGYYGVIFYSISVLAVMEGAYGKLCEVCGEILLRNNICERVYLYDNYREFLASKNNECVICSLLWEAHKPPAQDKRGAENVDNDYEFGRFRIYGYVSIGSSVRWPYVNFCIEARWAEDSTMCLRIREWDSSCQTKHKYCNLNRRHRVASGLGANTFFPSRVIDVEKADIGIVSLRDRAEVLALFGSKNDNYPVYWTLSHRWGETNAMPRLLKETERGLREGVKLDELPPINRTWPAFRDAALLVKRLGYRYLWIDSLCIFQDSEIEWQREAGMMVDIYRHSYCNISAIFSSHDPANTGLFRKRGLSCRLFYPFLINEDNDKPSWLWYLPSWENEVGNAPLKSRGWVVQERFLSTRTIYFAEHQILWECLEATDYEVQLSSKVLKQAIALVTRDRTESYENDPKSYLYASNIKMPKELYNEWDRVVNYYMSCGLTKESDRIIAISGIAKAFHEATGDTYLAGLWKSRLEQELLWCIFRRGEYRIQCHGHTPSWSWISLTEGVLNPRVRLQLSHDRYTSCIKLIEERIVPNSPDGDSFGLLQSAELEIECTRLYLQLGSETNEDETTVGVYYDEARSRPLEIYYDIPDSRDRSKGGSLIHTFIPIAIENSIYHRINSVHGLIVEREANNKYKRVGCLQCRWDTCYYDEELLSEKSHIILI